MMYNLLYGTRCNKSFNKIIQVFGKFSLEVFFILIITHAYYQLRVNLVCMADVHEQYVIISCVPTQWRLQLSFNPLFLLINVNIHAR